MAKTILLILFPWLCLWAVYLLAKLLWGFYDYQIWAPCLVLGGLGLFFCLALLVGTRKETPEQ